MVSLEQVRALETRVEKAVALIASLKNENAQLRTGLVAAEGRVAELEGLVKEFQQDQVRIEQGIVQALRKLDQFEDVVHAASEHPAVNRTAEEHEKNPEAAEKAASDTDMFAEEEKKVQEDDDGDGDEGSEDPALDSTQLF